MRGVGIFARAGLFVAGAILVSGCIPSTRTPERLYPVASEMDFVRSTQSDLVDRYYKAALSGEQMRLIRNEIIAQRMYAIDVQYTQYESALTQESQEVGFGATTAAEGLSTAVTLVGPPGTKTILSGAATAVLASKGHYESEVLLAQTMRTIQKQMRASRNRIATSISARTAQGVADYPLAAAMSDVEDYYNAGTLTTGVIDTSTTVGMEEDESKKVKQIVQSVTPSERPAVLDRVNAQTDRPPPIVVTRTITSTSVSDSTSSVLKKWLSPGGVLDTARRDQLRSFLATESPGLQITTFLGGPDFAVLRTRFARQQNLIP